MIILPSRIIERIATILTIAILAIATGFYYYEYTLLNNSSVGPSISSQTPTVSADLNWGGYAVASDFNNPQPIVTEVIGSWIVPQIIPTQTDTFSAIWIGIGGTFGNTLIQAGTEQDSIDGQAVYSAWFELLPQDSVTIPTINVSPGDTIDACINLVDSSTNLWMISIGDMTNGQNFVQNFTYASGQLSAEWVVERPNVNNALTGLASFGTVTMTTCMAMLNGKLGTIGNFTYVQDLMTNRQRTPLVAVSTISNGSTFKVKYLQSQ